MCFVTPTIQIHILSLPHIMHVTSNLYEINNRNQNIEKLQLKKQLSRNLFNQI